MAKSNAPVTLHAEFVAALQCLCTNPKETQFAPVFSDSVLVAFRLAREYPAAAVSVGGWMRLGRSIYVPPKLWKVAKP